MRVSRLIALAAVFAVVTWGATGVLAGEHKDKDEKNVTIDQVPAAVKAAILKEAGDNKIKESEAETKNGTTVYEAEWVADGKEVEIKVSADGAVLKKKVEDADDDDGDQADDGDDDDDGDQVGDDDDNDDDDGDQADDDDDDEGEEDDD
jgi:hypothetical protein